MSTTSTVNINDHSRQKPLSDEHPITTEVVKKDITYFVKLNDGSSVKLASTSSPVVLYEAHNSAEGSKTYPDAHYLSPDDVDFKLLKKSDTITYCPYKGYASYYSVIDGPEDVAWVYEEAYDQVSDIRGKLAFYQNKVTTTA